MIGDKDGQVAPFLIVILVVLLMATMVTVNIGKIGLTKTRTSNAADAGALAGASIMANGLNAIGDISAQMLADSLAAEAVIASGTLNCAYVPYYLGATNIAQYAMFAYAWRLGSMSIDEAGRAARQLAFSNVGIDQAKEPRGSNEDYETWVKKDSPFQQWMHAEGYVSGYYSWADKQGGENSVRVDIGGPDDFNLLPTPLPLTGSCRFPCPPHGICVLGIYALINFANIIEATNDEDPIQLTVTRVEPEADLGLWQMRYAAAGEEGISSYAEGRAYGGSVAPFGSDYDSQLSGAN